MEGFRNMSKHGYYRAIHHMFGKHLDHFVQELAGRNRICNLDVGSGGLAKRFKSKRLFYKI